MRLNKLSISTPINEGLTDFIGGLFFIDPKDDKQPKLTPKPKLHQEDAAEPFGGVCKFKKSVLIPENTEYRFNDTKLINAAAQMFRGNWVNNKDAQNCLKSVIHHLLGKYLEGYKNTVNDLDMNVIADAIADDKLTYDTTNKDYKVIHRVYKRIKAHKDRIFDDMVKNPGNFKNKWADAKTELATVIENVLKTGGDPSALMGQQAAAASDRKRGK